MSSVKEETFLEKERRLKKRKQTYIETYAKGSFLEYADKDKIADWIKQGSVIVRLNKAGRMDDDTEFVSITIEGIAPIENK